MAQRYWVSGGTTDWNSTTNWSTSSGGASGASVPTTADDTIFDAASGAGDVTINVATALVISTTFTGFTGTLVVNNTLSSRGVVLGTGMSFNTTTGTPILRMTGTCSYTSNGVTFPYRLDVGNADTTLTLNDNITVQDLHRTSNTTVTLTMNGNTLSVLGDFRHTGTGTVAALGTTTIALIGTGTWSMVGTGAWRNPLTINTAGTITVSGVVRYDTEVFTYTAGTVDTTGSTLTIGASTTLDTVGITWNQITISAAATLTLTSDLNVATFLVSTGVTTLAGAGIFLATTLSFGTATTGGLTLNRDITITNFVKTSGTGIDTITNNTITITGDITLGTATGNKAGTTNILYTGTGTWSGITTGNKAYNFAGAAFTINTAGTLTIEGIVGVGTTFNYIAGTITITTGIFNIDGAVTLNVNGITWGDIIITGESYDITLGEDLNVGGTTRLESKASVTFTLDGNSLNLTDLIGTSGTYTIPTTLNVNNATLINSTTNVRLNTNTINISGNLTTTGTGTCLGTTTLVLGGTGTWSNSSTGVIRNNLTINTAGIITVSGIVRYNTGVLTYTAGTVVTTGSTLNIAVSTALDTSGMTWDNVNPNISNTLRLTLTSALAATTLTINSNTTFLTNGFNVGTLIAAVAGLTIQLPSTQTSTITTNFTCIVATNANRVLFRSTTPESKALLNLDPTATQKLAYVNATDINSLGGKTIYSFEGVFTNTDNWELLPTEPVGGEASFTFVN